MPIAIEQLDYCSVIKLEKFFDARIAIEARVAFDEFLKHANKNVFIDFSDTSALDSSGIGALVYLFKRVHRLGLTLEFTGLQGQPLKKIRNLHLDDVIKISGKTHRI